MQAKDMYSLVVVEDPAAVQEWYVRHLGFVVVLSTSWFVYLASGGPRRFGLAFMRHGLDTQLPQFRTPLTGDALIITIEVNDAGAALAEVRASGLEPVVSLRDEPWGQRHFMLRDPAGCWVDVVQQIEPMPGFFDESTQQQLAALTGPGDGRPAA